LTADGSEQEKRGEWKRWRDGKRGKGRGFSDV